MADSRSAAAPSAGSCPWVRSKRRRIEAAKKHTAPTKVPIVVQSTLRISPVATNLAATADTPKATEGHRSCQVAHRGPPGEVRGIQRQDPWHITAKER